MFAEELLVKWANKKFPEYKGKITKVVSTEMSFSSGGCPTCSYGDEVYKDAKVIFDIKEKV